MAGAHPPVTIAPAAPTPQPRSANSIIFAVVDGAGRIVKQGYCDPDKLAKQAPDGQKAYKLPGIIDARRYSFTDGVLTPLKDITALPAEIATGDDLKATLSVPPGAVVNIYQSGKFTADAAGKAQVTFPAAGAQYVQIDAAGYSLYGARHIVTTDSQRDAVSDAAINAQRDASLGAALSTSLGPVIPDPTTLSALTALVTIGQGGDWVFSDNTIKTLTAAQAATLLREVASGRSGVVLTARKAKDDARKARKRAS